MRRPNDEPYNGATMKPEAPAGPIHTPMRQQGNGPPVRVLRGDDDLTYTYTYTHVEGPI